MCSYFEKCVVCGANLGKPYGMTDTGYVCSKECLVRHFDIETKTFTQRVKESFAEHISRLNIGRQQA